jgi:hypothetical protein
MMNDTFDFMDPLNQFIEIAPDCTLKQAIVPLKKGAKQSVATIEYELLSKKPYAYTLQELKFATYVQQKQIPPLELKTQRRQIMQEFMAKPYACMRASPLTKTYGWGAHYNEEGKIAIYAVGSEDYLRLVEDESIKKYFAMRSKRE